MLAMCLSGGWKFGYYGQGKRKSADELQVSRDHGIKIGNGYLMGETGRLQDWKDCCYYCCYGKEREMERCGSSQGLDLGVAAGG
jgi:hypothetical protein